MSVRVRVTAVAVVVTAVALGVGAWGLMRSVERTQLGRIAAAADTQVKAVAAQLGSGVTADRLHLSGTGGAVPAGVVQVISADGAVLATSGSGSIGPLVGSTAPLAGGTGEVSPPGAVTATVPAGGGPGPVTGAVATARIEAPDTGVSGVSTPLEIRSERVDTPNGQVTVVAALPLAEVSRSLAAVRQALWVGLPVVLALLGLLTWTVTGRALRPVEAMRSEAEAITHTTLHRRLPEPARADEVGRLARTMNAMLDRLEGAAEQQRRFVADASHELRTPVATMRTELEVAQQAGDHASLRDAVDGALREEARLEALLTDLLLLAAAESPVPGERAQPVDLGGLVAAEARRPRAVPVEVDGAGTVTGSEKQLERAVRNLLDNAARHASTCVHVTVDGGRLLVDDDGPGIPLADRSRIFERFTRLDEGRARDDGGSGLGLSIVRAVAAAHGGTVCVEDAPGLGGARFVLDLRRP